jgi:hypothetical protein
MLCLPSKKSASESQTSGIGKHREPTSICGIQLHSLKAFMLLQYSASPFPYTTQVGLPAELIALLDDRDWVPVMETYVGSFEIDEEVTWA